MARSMSLLGLIGLAALALCVPASASSDVRVFILAPSQSKSLDSVETHGADKPYFAHSFAIPYGSLQALANQKAKQLLAGIKLGDTVKCPSACPDIHWTVTLTPTITFVDKAPPVIAAFGPAQANGAEIQLSTKVRIQLNGTATLSATVLGEDVSKDTPVAIDLLIALDVRSKLNLWPTIQPQIVACDQSKDPVYVCAKASLLQSNVELRDLHNAVLVSGALLGPTVGGAITGDMFSGLVLALTGAGPAEKAAKNAVQTAVSDAVSGLLTDASQQATVIGSDYLNTGTIKADAIRQQLLDMQIPGVNKSLQQLQSAFGMTFDVQTTTHGGTVTVLVTPRFVGTGNATIYGRLRLPKSGCTYKTATGGKADITIPLGMTEWNQDLKDKVGKLCSTIFPGSQPKANGYLGANPLSAKAGGTALMSWTPAGAVTFTGSLESHPHAGGAGDKFTPTGYYECAFTINGVQAAGIFELKLPASTFASRMAETYAASAGARHLTVHQGPLKVLLDRNWKIENDGIVAGGEGFCEGAKTHMHVYGPTNEDKLRKALEGFDPRQCANCNIQLQDGRLVIENVDELINVKAPLNQKLKGERNLRAPTVTTKPAEH